MGANLASLWRYHHSHCRDKLNDSSSLRHRQRSGSTFNVDNSSRHRWEAIRGYSGEKVNRHNRAPCRWVYPVAGRPQNSLIHMWRMQTRNTSAKYEYGIINSLFGSVGVNHHPACNSQSSKLNVERSRAQESRHGTTSLMDPPWNQ